MEITPQLIAGVAAVVAAVIAAILSAVNLAVSGRREQLRWRREALTEVLVRFVDTTFQGVPSAAFDLRLSGGDPEKYRQGAIDSHAEMVNSLTRMRMLARNRVVKKAVEIHAVQDRIYDAIYHDADLMDTGEFEMLVTKRRRLRNEFLKLARRNLGLWGSAEIDDSQAPTGPSMRAVTKEVPAMRIHLVREPKP